MSRVLATVFAALLSAEVSAGVPAPQYTNPILYADYSDPDVIRVGQDYYLVASSFHFSPGIPILKSRDLVHWRIIGHVLPRLTFAAEYDMIPPFTLTDAIQKPTGPGLRYASGVWAPSIRYHKGLFYVYWPTPDEGIFMATAKDPAGPWSAPVAVMNEPLLEDPCPFWDDDGSAWLVHSRVRAGPLVLHRMSADGTRVLDQGEVIALDPVNLPVLEGPKLYKRNHWYYIFAPIGGVETGSQVVGRARNIRGPYEWRTVLAPGSTAVQGPHQGGYVETPGGEGWFIHFNSTGAFGRIVHLQPVQWHDDWPVMGQPVPGTTYGQPVASFRMPNTGSEIALPFQDSDEFSTPTLGPQWEWNHNPVDAAWSLTARPDWLRMRALPAAHLVTAHNTLTQILQGPAMTATTRIDVSGMTEGQRAGLAIFGTRPSWIGVIRDGGVTRIAFASEGVEQPGVPIPGAVIQLRLHVGAEQLAKFQYSLDDGASFADLGTPAALRFAWWKGARPALFTYIKSPPGDASLSGYMDVDWFRIAVERGAPAK